MNKRIRKKKQKQQEQIEQAIAGLLEVVEEALAAMGGEKHKAVCCGGYAPL